MLAVHVLPASYSWDEVRQSWSHGPGPAEAGAQGKPPGQHAADKELTKVLDEVTQPLQVDDWAEAP